MSADAQQAALAAVAAPGPAAALAANRDWADATLSRADFAAFSAFIHDHCGIRYPPGKHVTLEARLRRRLRALGLATFEEYRARVLGAGASPEEVVRMIDEVTTNKTDFFREPAHFDFLTGHALPALIKLRADSPTRPLVVWSAACSTGEEVFTLAMVLEDAATGNRRGPGATPVAAGSARLRYSILGTDISTEVVATARRGVYDESMVEPVPLEMRHRYLMQSRDRSRPQVRVVPALRAKVRFEHLNLLTPFALDEPADVIFCRNVLIYFDRATQHRVLERLCQQLVPGGFLFVGHSDSLTGLDLPLVSQGPSVYRKIGPGVAVGHRRPRPSKEPR